MGKKPTSSESTRKITIVFAIGEITIGDKVKNGEH